MARTKSSISDQCIGGTYSAQENLGTLLTNSGFGDVDRPGGNKDPVGTL